jgi:hypothetical protein
MAPKELVGTPAGLLKNDCYRPAMRLLVDRRPVSCSQLARQWEPKDLCLNNDLRDSEYGVTPGGSGSSIALVVQRHCLFRKRLFPHRDAEAAAQD